MEKSLRKCKQITLIIVLYPGTKFELICAAPEVAKPINLSFLKLK